MLECGWPQHRRKQEMRTGASDAGASRAWAGSKDGSLGKSCEGFDQISCLTGQRQMIGCQTSASCLTGQRQIIGCQTSAFLVSQDALVRAPLPARLAVVEGPCVHSSINAGARLSSLEQSDVLKVEGLTPFQKLCPKLVIREKS